MRQGCGMPLHTTGRDAVQPAPPREVLLVQRPDASKGPKHSGAHVREKAGDHESQLPGHPPDVNRAIRRRPPLRHCRPTYGDRRTGQVHGHERGEGCLEEEYDTSAEFGTNGGAGGNTPAPHGEEPSDNSCRGVCKRKNHTRSTEWNDWREQEYYLNYHDEHPAPTLRVRHQGTTTTTTNSGPTTPSGKGRNAASPAQATHTLATCRLPGTAHVVQEGIIWKQRHESARRRNGAGTCGAQPGLAPLQ